MIRLDKFISNYNLASRSEVKKLCKQQLIKVNNIIVKNSDTKINEGDIITFIDNDIVYKQYHYIMMNKPQGYISATHDKSEHTIFELIDNPIKDLNIVGRLDKDTTGLLLLTNDGELNHNLLSPKKHVYKTYYALIAGKVTNDDIKAFNDGININNEYITLPAILEIIESNNISKVKVTIKEGKYHQIKRMFIALNKEVLELKRLSIKNLVLDNSLELGQYRYLTKEEIDDLKSS